MIDITVTQNFDKMTDGIRASANSLYFEIPSMVFLTQAKSRWEQFVDDPDFGFGTASFPGKRHEINHTGLSKSGIHNEIKKKGSGWEWSVSEGVNTLRFIRQGKSPIGPPTGGSGGGLSHEHRQLYEWALTKIYGRSLSEAYGPGASADLREARRNARYMMLYVSQMGTSTEYARNRQVGATVWGPGSQSTKGFDYPAMFLALYENALLTFQDDAEEEWQVQVQSTIESYL